MFAGGRGLGPWSCFLCGCDIILRSGVLAIHHADHACISEEGGHQDRHVCMLTTTNHSHACSKPHVGVSH